MGGFSIRTFYFPQCWRPEVRGQNGSMGFVLRALFLACRQPPSHCVPMWQRQGQRLDWSRGLAGDRHTPPVGPCVPGPSCGLRCVTPVGLLPSCTVRPSGWCLLPSVSPAPSTGRALRVFQHMWEWSAPGTVCDEGCSAGAHAGGQGMGHCLSSDL